MKPNGVINLILPAVEIVQDHQPTDSLLAALGTSTKEVIELFLNAWAEFKHLDESDYPYYGITDNFSRGIYDQSMRQSFRINARLMVMDILFDAMERRIENGEGFKLGDKDRHDAERVLMSIWESLSTAIFSLLEEMQLSDIQISQLRFVRWIGDDFVISIPRYHTAQQLLAEKRIEHERKREQDRVEQLRAESPLCYHRPDRGDDEPGN